MERSTGLIIVLVNRWYNDDKHGNFYFGRSHHKGSDSWQLCLIRCKVNLCRKRSIIQERVERWAGVEGEEEGEGRLRPREGGGAGLDGVKEIVTFQFVSPWYKNVAECHVSEKLMIKSLLQSKHNI